MRSFILALLILVTVLTVVPLPVEAQSFSLVPCGKASDQPQPPLPPGQPLTPAQLVAFPNAVCGLHHLFIAITRMINYLVSVAALVAIYQILAAGFWMATALGNAEVIQKNKQALQNAVVGFALIVMSFMLVNLLVNGIFGKADATRPWWDLNCLYNITASAGCPI